MEGWFLCGVVLSAVGERKRVLARDVRKIVGGRRGYHDFEIWQRSNGVL